jgi:hypothetical protein
MLPTVVAGPELVPHFGLLGSRSFRWTFFRNFWDTDQRPLRGVLDRLRPPLLILHGRHDALVPAWAAVEHHRLVPGSELHLFDDTHFMLFDAGKTARLAGPLGAFLAAHAVGGPRPGSGRVLTEDGRSLPERTLWPAAAQVAVPAAVAAASPAAGCLCAGGLTGLERADWFAGWLGAFAGGAVRRGANGIRRAVRWLGVSLAVTTGAVIATAAVGWPGLLAAGGGWAVWRLVRKRGSTRGVTAAGGPREAAR